jgi:hypothetical protein
MVITMKSGRGGQRKGAGRKSTWQHRETCLLRVPVAIANELMQIAHKLDRGEILEFDTNSNQDEIIQILNRWAERRKKISRSTAKWHMMHRFLDEVESSLSAKQIDLLSRND